jgi:hypothetical protein
MTFCLPKDPKDKLVQRQLKMELLHGGKNKAGGRQRKTELQKSETGFYFFPDS